MCELVQQVSALQTAFNLLTGGKDACSGRYVMIWSRCSLLLDVSASAVGFVRSRLFIRITLYLFSFLFVASSQIQHNLHVTKFTPAN